MWMSKKEITTDDYFGEPRVAAEFFEASVCVRTLSLSDSCLLRITLLASACWGGLATAFCDRAAGSTVIDWFVAVGAIASTANTVEESGAL